MQEIHAGLAAKGGQAFRGAKAARDVPEVHADSEESEEKQKQEDTAEVCSILVISTVCLIDIS